MESTKLPWNQWQKSMAFHELPPYFVVGLFAICHGNLKLEDLKVLRRSPDLLDNVKIGQGQLQLIMEQILVLPYTFWSSDLNNLMNNPSNSQVISEKKMFR